MLVKISNLNEYAHNNHNNSIVIIKLMYGICIFSNGYAQNNSVVFIKKHMYGICIFYKDNTVKYHLYLEFYNFIPSIRQNVTVEQTSLLEYLIQIKAFCI